ncbi:hypothetical protein L915_15835 [Phytophthora nicotianae]|uniref:3'-5' exonuclease domain-containing protein n=1 Tax=Phytophthora nicotianae TaxID=4792 RepID=W2G750_PHYNI|nr:hypothetical protein L915_15835 [Phytophthora nicotianae]
MKGLDTRLNVDQKLLVELLGLFQINDIEPNLVRNAMEHLLAFKSHAALIKLCETFPELDWPFETIVTRMAQTKDWMSAELLVKTFAEDDDTALATVLIDATINIRDFKRAHRLVVSFNLQKQYPDVDALYTRDGLMRLIEAQRWQLALTFVGHDTTLQKVLLEHMVTAGELAHAAHLVKMMVNAGLVPDISPMIPKYSDSGEIGQGVEDEGFYALPEKIPSITFCNDENTVRDAMEHFFGSTSSNKVDDKQVVGLDVEWKPIIARSKATTAVASILQIASSDGVFVVDLLALHDNDLLFDSFLPRLLTSPQWLKLGFGFDSDLKVLHQTFPERQSFTGVSPFLDLNTLELTSGPINSGLSQCVHHVLGKPLDKRMQLSDWEHRPLSQEQKNYAALDALCLVHIVRKLQNLSDNDKSLPSWSEVSKRIVTLNHAVSLSEDEKLEAVSHRIAYQKKWRHQCDEASCMTKLVTPQDVLQFWEDRRRALLLEQKLTFDTTLKFLTKDQMTAMLQDPQEDADTRDFIAVNSICIFIAETPSVVCIEANYKLDMVQIARLRGVGRRKVRLAAASECRRVFGFAPGTVAPFGHKPWTSKSEDKSTHPVLINLFVDSRLQKAQYLAAGSGSPDKVIWVESKAFFALISIELLDDISIPRDSPTSVDNTDKTSGNIAETEPKPLEHKFLADSMVTQVGRWLRTIGVDVVTWNPEDVKATRSTDPKSVMLAFAATEDRIVLTRDTGLPSRRDAGACFVLSDDECYKQFREVKLQFGLVNHIGTRSSRCARCNSDTFSPINADSARKKMSERLRKKVPISVTTFWNCDGCGRVYWEGPKYTPSTNNSVESSLAGRVVYRPVPRKRVAGDHSDTRHLPDPEIASTRGTKSE